MAALPLPYYYGYEAEQFSFYRIPKRLFEDDRFRGVSTDAKLLYGMLLDRMALSIKNGWLVNHGQGRPTMIYVKNFAALPPP